MKLQLLHKSLLLSILSHFTYFSTRVMSFILLGIALATFAQQADAQRTDFQSWSLVTSTVRIGEKKEWLLYLEAQPRIGDEISQMERLLLRPALGYAFTSNISLFLGYAWTPTFMDAHYRSDFRDENRIWQQLLIRDHRLGLDWQHRLRQEQRMIEDAGGVTSRIRYLIRGSAPLNACESFGLTGYNELFVTLNSVERGPRAGFDRNRLFLGPYFVEGPARFEVGYLGEYGKRFGSEDRMINAVLTSVNFSF